MKMQATLLIIGFALCTGLAAINVKSWLTMMAICAAVAIVAKLTPIYHRWFDAKLYERYKDPEEFRKLIEKPL